MNYLDTAWFGVVMTLVMVFFILFNIWRGLNRKGSLFIRRIPGLNAIDDAIGRATEMGRPVFMVPGIGALNAISMQAINIFADVTKKASQFATPIRLCCADAAVYTVAQEVIRDVYVTQGLGDRFDSNSVQFVSDRQFAFAAGVSGMILRDQAAATFLLGEFYAESLIFAETANSVGAIQVAGSTQQTQTPFFIAACDYVLIGDEFYAASAYLRREPVLVGSLIGQDWGKALILGMIVLFGLLTSVDRLTPVAKIRTGEDDEVLKEFPNTEKLIDPSEDRLKASRNKGRLDTWTFRLMNPLITKEMLTVERQIDEAAKAEAEAKKAAAEQRAAQAGGGS